MTVMLQLLLHSLIRDRAWTAGFLSYRPEVATPIPLGQLGEGFRRLKLKGAAGKDRARLPAKHRLVTGLTDLHQQASPQNFDVALKHKGAVFRDPSEACPKTGEGVTALVPFRTGHTLCRALEACNN
jgi:hypothetical protein